MATLMVPTRPGEKSSIIGVERALVCGGTPDEALAINVHHQDGARDVVLFAQDDGITRRVQDAFESDSEVVLGQYRADGELIKPCLELA